MSTASTKSAAPRGEKQESRAARGKRGCHPSVQFETASELAPVGIHDVCLTEHLRAVTGFRLKPMRDCLADLILNAQQRGYAYKYDQTLADKYGVSRRTIVRWKSTYAELGYGHTVQTGHEAHFYPHWAALGLVPPEGVEIHEVAPEMSQLAEPASQLVSHRMSHRMSQLSLDRSERPDRDDREEREAAAVLNATVSPAREPTPRPAPAAAPQSPTNPSPESAAMTTANPGGAARHERAPVPPAAAAASASSTTQTQTQSNEGCAKAPARPVAARKLASAPSMPSEARERLVALPGGDRAVDYVASLLSRGMSAYALEVLLVAIETARPNNPGGWARRLYESGGLKERVEAARATDAAKERAEAERVAREQRQAEQDARDKAEARARLVRTESERAAEVAREEADKRAEAARRAALIPPEVAALTAKLIATQGAVDREREQRRAERAAFFAGGARVEIAPPRLVAVPRIDPGVRLYQLRRDVARMPAGNPLRVRYEGEIAELERQGVLATAPAETLGDVLSGAVRA